MDEQNEELKATVEKPELTAEQRADLEKKQEYFARLRLGGLFVNFVFADLERQKKQHLNRASRRRIDKDLRKGVITPELVQTYLAKFDVMEKYFQDKLSPKTQEEPTVDGAEFYEKAKQEANQQG